MTQIGTYLACYAGFALLLVLAWLLAVMVKLYLGVRQMSQMSTFDMRFWKNIISRK